jgi:outer membrane protein OmpA-like peptidoglycan-associated protein
MTVDFQVSSIGTRKNPLPWRNIAIATHRRRDPETAGRKGSAPHYSHAPPRPGPAEAGGKDELTMYLMDSTVSQRLERLGAAMPPGLVPRKLTVAGFDFNRAVLKPEHRNALAALAREIGGAWAGAGGRTMVNIVTIGHTDPVGSVARNTQLSWQRALTVRDALKKLLGLRLGSQLLFFPSAAGATKPIASNRTAGGRAQNRRVELQITFAALPARNRKLAPAPPPRTPIAPIRDRFPHISRKRPMEWRNAVQACRERDGMAWFKRYYEPLSMLARSSSLRLDHEGNLQLYKVNKVSFFSLVSSAVRKKIEEQLIGKAEGKALDIVLGKQLANLFGWAQALKEIYDKEQNRKLVGGGREWEEKRYQKRLSMLMSIVADDLARRQRRIAGERLLWLRTNYNKYASILNRCLRYEDMEYQLRTGRTGQRRPKGAHKARI